LRANDRTTGASGDAVSRQFNDRALTYMGAAEISFTVEGAFFEHCPAAITAIMAATAHPAPPEREFDALAIDRPCFAAS
jgi:hypothetical protein